MCTIKRSYSLDILKGLAILSVILFHVNIFTYGYLGVDIFLVIAGYLTTKSIINQYEKGEFSYWNFLRKRIIRLWPLLLLISIFSLSLGYFTMFPTNLKNTAETAIGTSLFLNNFVQYITAGDYWDSANEYKPLMHTWYIAVVFQFYMLYPLFFIVAKRQTKRWESFVTLMLLVAGIISFLLFLSPLFTIAFRFYLLPLRLFEFISGGILVLIARLRAKSQKWALWMCLLMLFIVMSINTNISSGQSKLLGIVILTSVFLWLTDIKKNLTIIPNIKLISLFGRASYSIYLWHQVIISFYRNIFNDQLTTWEYVLLIGSSLLWGVASYQIFEQPIAKIDTNKSRKILGVCCISTILLVLVSSYFYKREGVVRNIPELDLDVSRCSTWITQSYNDGVHKYDIDFPHNGKKNVLVVGDSYARDWYNVMKESKYADSINLSYHKALDKLLEERIKKADFIFLANHGGYEEFDSYLPIMMKKRFYRVGDKKFFSSPCIVYNKRFNLGSYYKQSAEISDEVLERNKKESQIFGKNYISTINAIKDKKGFYNIFTPEHKLISHDGLHLTKAGARFYALRLDIGSFFH